MYAGGVRQGQSALTSAGGAFGAAASRVWVTGRQALRVPQTITPRRHRAPRRASLRPRPLPLCKCDSAAPPIRGRVGAVTWREASFLCAPLFPSSAAILFLPRVGLRGLRRTQVSRSPVPLGQCRSVGTATPTPAASRREQGVAAARRRPVAVRRAGPWRGRGPRPFPEERPGERGRAEVRGAV